MLWTSAWYAFASYVHFKVLALFYSSYQSQMYAAFNEITAFSSCIYAVWHACMHTNAYTKHTPSGRPSPTFTHTFLQLSSCYTLQARFKIFYKQHLTTQPNSKIDRENVFKYTYTGLCSTFRGMVESTQKFTVLRMKNERYIKKRKPKKKRID